MVIGRDRFFYLILTQTIDFFSLLPLNTNFLFKKRPKKLLNTLICNMMSSFKHINDVTCLLTCGCRFLSFPRAGTICEIKSYLKRVKTAETQIWSARITLIKAAQSRLTHTSYVVFVSQNFDLRPCLEKDSW